MKSVIDALAIDWAPVVAQLDQVNWRWLGKPVTAEMLDANARSLLQHKFDRGQTVGTGGLTAECLYDGTMELHFDFVHTDCDWDVLSFRLDQQQEWPLIQHLWDRIWSDSPGTSLESVVDSKHELLTLKDSLNAKIQKVYDLTLPRGLSGTDALRLKKIGVPVPSKRMLSKWIRHLRSVDSNWNSFQHGNWTIRKYAAFGYDIRYSLLCKQWLPPVVSAERSTWWNMPPSSFAAHILS